MEVHWSILYRDYTEEEIHHYAPTDGGVYLLWVRMKSRKWKCFFVGSADNIEESLLRHISPDEPNEDLREQLTDFVCGFEYARVDDSGMRKRVEKFLYDHFRPEFNTVDPGGEPLAVNVP